MAIQTINPATNKVIKSFEEMSDSMLESLLTKSSEIYPLWKKTSYKERASLLYKVAKLMRENKKSLAKIITLEMGKLIAQAEAEIDLSADIFDYYATNSEQFLTDKILNPTLGSALIRHSSIGVFIRRSTLEFSFLSSSPICCSEHHDRKHDIT